MTSKELKQIRQSIIAGDDIDFKALEKYGIFPTYEEQDTKEIDIYGLNGDINNYQKIDKFIKPYQLEKPRYKRIKGNIPSKDKPLRIEIEYTKKSHEKQKQITCN